MSRRSRYSGYEPVIIVGSGIAGLLLAIELAENGQRTIVVTKGRLDQSNTAWAQGGLAAVTDQNVLDCADRHFLDTVAAGDGLTDHLVVREIIGGGKELVRRLVELGVQFDLSSLVLEGGHSLARVVHSADATGRSIVTALVHRVRSSSLVTILEDSFLREIVVENGYACGILVDVHERNGIVNGASANGIESGAGANGIESGASGNGIGGGATANGIEGGAGANGIVYGASTNGIESSAPVTTRRIDGKAVVLATGGLGQVYARTTNPFTATGDGIAAAFRAGASLTDMEFVQFHPTALHLPGAPAFLISEAVRGAGAVLLDRSGERFAQRYNPAGELATRDKVSRAIFWNMRQEGSECVWLDMSVVGKAKIEGSFPNIVARLRSYGIDPVKEPVPVSPAAHYFMGGILADELGRTTLPGLYAIGECASTGLHGANRLASNSLLEGGVMALSLTRHISGKDKRALAVDQCRLSAEDIALPYESSSYPMGTSERDMFLSQAEFDLAKYKDDLMLSAGLVRTEESLRDFLNRYGSRSQMERTDAEVSKNVFTLGQLIAFSALQRRESRGAHWRSDYPERDDSKYRARLVLNRDGQLWLPVRDAEPAHITVSIASARALAAGG